MSSHETPIEAHGDEASLWSLLQESTRQREQLERLYELAKRRLHLTDDLNAALFSATHQMARLCEAGKREPNSTYVHRWFARQQAMLTGEVDKLKTDETRLVLYMETDADEIVSRAERSVSDIAFAVRQALHLDPEAVTSAQIIDVWSVAERSNRRVKDDQRSWRLEQDAVKLAEEMSALDPRRQPTPYTAMEVIRRLVLGDRFDYRSTQMAFILGPSIIRAGFAAPRALAGIARAFRTDQFAMRSLAADEDRFALAFFKAVAEDAQRTSDAMYRFAQVEAKLIDMAPIERKSSLMPKAIRSFLEVPITSTPGLAQRLGLTRKGAQVIIDKLVGAGVLQIHNHEAQKGKLYVCTQAMGI